jgi:NADP-reducing hydrogenase subunit HndD
LAGRRAGVHGHEEAHDAMQLQHPNSAHAHALLHTSYAARHSRRSLLMLFLDCVDRRDGPGAARLLHPDASLVDRLTVR